MRFVQALSTPFVVLLLVVGLGACEQPSTTDVDRTEEGVLRLGSVEAVDTLTRAVSPSGRPLTIEGVRGTVELQGTDDPTAQLRFVRHGRGKDAETARGVLADLDITESGSETGYTYTLEKNGGAYAAVDVTGAIPRTTALTIDRTTGPVSITGIEGLLTVTHEHGAVSIREAADSVTVEVKNGDVDVQFAALPSAAEVTLRTVNGDVNLSLPPDASAQLSAETSVGAVQTQGLDLTEQHFTPRDAGGQYSAQLGDGAASVELQTKNGSILIAAVDTGRAEPAPGDPVAAPERTGAVPDLTVPPSDTTVTPTAPSDTATVDTTNVERDTTQVDTTEA